jgi:hypothetical protein
MAKTVGAYFKNANIKLLEKIETDDSGHSKYEVKMGIAVYLEQNNNIEQEMPDSQHSNYYNVLIQRNIGNIDPAVHRIEYDGKLHIIESYNKSGFGNLIVYEVLMREVNA